MLHYYPILETQQKSIFKCQFCTNRVYDPLYTQVEHLPSLGLVQNQGPCFPHVPRHKAWYGDMEKQGANPQGFDARLVCKKLYKSTVKYGKDQSIYDSICVNHSNLNAYYSTEHSSQPKMLSYNSKSQNNVYTFPRRFQTLSSIHIPAVTLTQPSFQHPAHV